MTTYIAFLRGVNVGGHNRMKMEDLRAVVESLGHEDVETYIQSGNVVFVAPDSDVDSLGTGIHDAIEKAFGYDVPVMVRSRAALDDVVDGQPFTDPVPKGVSRYVSFLGALPTDEEVLALTRNGLEAERFDVRGREVYTEIDQQALGDDRRTDIERVLDVPATRRNWSVVTAIRDLVAP